MQILTGQVFRSKIISPRFWIKYIPPRWIYSHCINECRGFVSLIKRYQLQARVAVNESRHDTPRESLLYAQHAGGCHHRRLIVADQDASAHRVFRERGKVLWLVLAEWIKNTIRRLHYSQDVKKYRLQFAQEFDWSRTVSNLSLSSICDLWTDPLLSGHHQSCQSGAISFTNDECSTRWQVASSFHCILRCDLRDNIFEE